MEQNGDHFLCVIGECVMLLRDKGIGEWFAGTSEVERNHGSNRICDPVSFMMKK